MQARSSLLHPPAPTTLGQEALKAGEGAGSSPGASGWALRRQHSLCSAGRERLPVGAGGCPCSRCCRPVGARCLQHRLRCCPPPQPCPPFHTLRAAKHDVGWTGRARALRGKGGRCVPHSTAGLGGRGCRHGVPAPGTAWEGGRMPPRLPGHPEGPAGAA